MSHYTGPYIGVSGITTTGLAKACHNRFGSTSRRLGIGVIASRSSLRGTPLPSERAVAKTALPQNIPGIFLDEPNVFNVLHYVGPRDDGFWNDLSELHKYLGPRCHAIQFNMPWPDAEALTRYREQFGYSQQFILQVGDRAIEEAGGNARGVLSRLEQYPKEMIQRVLIDTSLGHGRPFKPKMVREFLAEIDRSKRFGLVVAGGLGPGTTKRLLGKLLEEFPDLSVDAEGRLRDGDHSLNLLSVGQYLQEASDVADSVLQS